MIIKITSMERSERETRSGIQSGIKISGMKLKDGVEDGTWDKFFSDYHDSTIIQGLEQIGVGGTADIKMERDGKFWNAVSVRPYMIGGGKAADSSPPVQSVPSKPILTPLADAEKLLEEYDQTQAEINWTRNSALSQAMDLIKVIIQAGMVKKTVTIDFVTMNTLDIAESFRAFLEGEDFVAQPDATAVEPEEEDKPEDDTDIVF